MIQADFTLTIAALTSLIPGLVMFKWIFYTYKREDMSLGTTGVEQCPFCTYIFWKVNYNNYPICPRCHSLIGEQESQSGD